MNEKVSIRDKKHIIRRLFGYVTRQRKLLAIAVFLAVGANITGLIWPLLSGFAIEAIEPGPGSVDFGRVFYYGGLMALFTLLSALMTYILSVVMVNMSQKVVSEMRREVFSKISTLPVEYFDKNQAGDIISRITYDLDTINTSVTNDIIQITTAILTVIGSLVMMMIISPFMLLVIFFTVPVSFLFTKRMTKKIKPLFRKRSKKLGELNGFVEEMISGQKTIKAYHREDNVIKRFDKKNKESVDAYYMAEYHGSTVGPAMNFINNFSLSIISVMGTVLYFTGMLSLGNVSSFVLYSRRFAGPVNEIANIISEIQSSIAAAERVFRLLDSESEPEDKKEATELRNVRGNVDIKDLTFSYVKGIEVLKNINLKVSPGEKIAIAGKTGSGKTTIVNLLMRFYDPQRGSISIDGKDIRDVTRKSLRLSYAMVLQDTWLFGGSIYDNIAYGRENATSKEVENACRAAGIHEYIMSLPDGYDTLITGEGDNISGGQKQLLTIARAMMLNANILILDEATSNVDTVTEQKVQDAMKELMKDKTCFIIAHRLSTIRNADRIIVMENGEIVQEGKHSELVSGEGPYRKMYIAGLN